MGILTIDLDKPCRRFLQEACMKRWNIEETIRFLKQTYDLENISVLKYARLQNMMALLLVAFYFVVRMLLTEP